MRFSLPVQRELLIAGLIAAVIWTVAGGGTDQQVLQGDFLDPIDHIMNQLEFVTEWEETAIDPLLCSTGVYPPCEGYFNGLVGAHCTQGGNAVSCCVDSHIIQASGSCASGLLCLRDISTGSVPCNGSVCTCRQSGCGNGVVESNIGETCEQGTMTGCRDPGANGECTACGDGAWQDVLEECDFNDPNVADKCTQTCFCKAGWIKDGAGGCVPFTATPPTAGNSCDEFPGRKCCFIGEGEYKRAVIGYGSINASDGQACGWIQDTDCAWWEHTMHDGTMLNEHLSPGQSVEVGCDNNNCVRQSDGQTCTRNDTDCLCGVHGTSSPGPDPTLGGGVGGDSGSGDGDGDGDGDGNATCAADPPQGIQDSVPPRLIIGKGGPGENGLVQAYTDAAIQYWALDYIKMCEDPQTSGAAGDQLDQCGPSCLNGEVRCENHGAISPNCSVNSISSDDEETTVYFLCKALCNCERGCM